MHSALNQIRWAAAGSFLLIGAGWAGAIYRSTPTYGGPDPAQLQVLAQRLGSQADDTVSALPDPPVMAAPRRVVTAPAPRRAATTVVPRSHLTAPVLPPAGPVANTTPPPAPAPAPVPVKPAESPVKSLALMGLTHRDQEDAAWLVDLNSMTRETAEVGERAFGFTVKEIGDERVLLARNGEEYELRLGEKSIPTPAGSQPVALSGDAGGFGDPSAFGNGRGGRRGRGQGGFGPSGFGQSGFGQAGFGGQGRRSSRSQYGGGRSSFGASSSAPGLGNSSSYSSNSGFSGNRGTRFGSNSGGFRSSTGFGGSTGGGRSFGGGSYGGSASMTSQFAAGTGGSTSNPQTARRRGSRLTGDTPALPSPQAIANPQTQRRTGSSSGSAFGQASAGGNGTNRTGNARFGTSGSTFQGR